MDSFRKNIPLEWISQAVKQTGRATVRKRRFTAEPLHHLFLTTATEWEKEDIDHSVCGLKLFSVDGTQFKVPETEDNRQLGYVSRQATFPSVLAVTLMSAHIHWLMPIKSKFRYEVVHEYTPYDKLISMSVSPQAQKDGRTAQGSAIKDQFYQCIKADPR